MNLDPSSRRNVLSYAPRSSSFVRKAIVAAAVLGLVGTGVAWWHVHLRTPTNIKFVPGPINIPPPDITVLDADGARQLQVIHCAIQPCTDDFHDRLQAARDRALQTLADAIDQHRGGIEPFIEDLQSFSSKIGLVGRAAGDSWNRKVNGYDSNYVRSRVEAALRWHVISDDKLKQDIQAALEQFASDVQTARNMYYASVRIQLAKLKVELNLPDLDPQIFESQMKDQLAAMTERIGKDVAGSFVGSTIAGIAIEETGRLLLTRVLAGVATQFATRAATIFAVSGGATITTSAGGAGAGTLAGPAGTVAGFIGGVAIGMAIDWWFDKASAARIGTELQQLIDAIKAESLKHTAASLDVGIANFKLMQEAALANALVDELR